MLVLIILASNVPKTVVAASVIRYVVRVPRDILLFSVKQLVAASHAKEDVNNA